MVGNQVVRAGVASAIGLALVAGSAAAEHHEIVPTPAPEGAQVYLISPTDGATVTSPLTVRFGLVGMGVAPAGVRNPLAGHHHLIIDAPTPAANAAIPKDEQHRHFGGGQTEVELELASGSHTLQLVLGDHIHVPHNPPVASATITITVE
jgi:hypothetical protein